MAGFCVIISGRLPGDKDDVSVWTPVREGFKLDEATFRQRVLAALPLLVRQNLDEAAAERLTQQLRASGVDACVQSDDAQLAFLERAGTMRGPLPLSALGMFIRPDERYRLRGDQEWQTWTEAGPALDLSLPDSFEDVLRDMPLVGVAPPKLPQIKPPSQSETAVKAQPKIGVVAPTPSIPAMPAMPAAQISGNTVAPTSPPPQKAAKRKVAPWKIVAVVWICAVVFYTVIPMIFSSSSSSNSASSDKSEESDGGQSSSQSAAGQTGADGLKKLVAGHSILVTLKPNGAPFGFDSNDGDGETNMAYSIGNGFIQECFVSVKNPSPHSCSPAVTIEAFGSPSTNCFGNIRNESDPNGPAIFVCVSDTTQAGGSGGDGDFEKMSIPAGIPYIQRRGNYGSFANYRFKIFPPGS